MLKVLLLKENLIDKKESIISIKGNQSLRYLDLRKNEIYQKFDNINTFLATLIPNLDLSYNYIWQFNTNTPSKIAKKIR